MKKIKLYQLGKYVGEIVEEKPQDFPGLYTLLLLKAPMEYVHCLEKCKGKAEELIGMFEQKEE